MPAGERRRKRAGGVPVGLSSGRKNHRGGERSLSLRSDLGLSAGNRIRGLDGIRVGVLGIDGLHRAGVAAGDGLATVCWTVFLEDESLFGEFLRALVSGDVSGRPSSASDLMSFVPHRTV